jgi:hypothetical protein
MSADAETRFQENARWEGHLNGQFLDITHEGASVEELLVLLYWLITALENAHAVRVPARVWSNSVEVVVPAQFHILSASISPESYIGFN